MIIYVGFATGGLWKSTDGGIHWKSLMDNLANEYIGAIGIAPSEPQHRLHRHRRGQQPAELVHRRRRLEDHRRRRHTGPTSGLDDSQSIGRIVVDPDQSRHRLRRGRRPSVRPERRSAASTRRRTAARPGRNPSTSIPIPASSTSSSIPPTRRRSTPSSVQRRRTWWGYNGGGPGSGALEDHRRRRHLDETRRRGLAETQGRHLRTHRDFALPHQAEHRLRAGGSRRQRRHRRRHRSRWRPFARRTRRRSEETSAAERGNARAAPLPRAAPPAASRRTGATPEAGRRRTRWHGGAPPPPDPNASGVFRSEDGGKTWTFMSNQNQRPTYFSQIRVDPVNDQKIFVGGNPGQLSLDGGKTWHRHDRLTHRLSRLLDQPQGPAHRHRRPRWRLRYLQRRRPRLGLSQRHGGRPVLPGLRRHAPPLLGLRRPAGQ